jgi:biopolymer transport protein ExbB/TolQ
MTRRDVEALPTAVQAAVRASARAAIRVHQDLKEGLNGLATVSCIAPLLGLFGTVVAISSCFNTGESKTSPLPMIAGNVSEACLPTALGLLVALMALWAYRYFSAHLQTFDHEMQIASSQLVSQLMMLKTTR